MLNTFEASGGDLEEYLTHQEAAMQIESCSV
jgi:hypothetical protein